MILKPGPELTHGHLILTPISSFCPQGVLLPDWKQTA